ncbi:hypothetical protein V8B97DRAFT_2025945 [Scleroderma yunnanense]
MGKSSLLKFNERHPLRCVSSITDPLTLGVECHPDLKPSDVEQFTFAILNEYLQPSSSASPIDTALQLNNGLPWGHPDVDRDVSAMMACIWDLVFRLAQQIPHDHPSQERLVQFIIALRDLPIDTPSFLGDPVEHFWRGVFEFSMDACFLTIPRVDIATDENTRQRWYNFNAFIARLARDGIGLRCAPFFCIWALYDLEVEPDPRSKAHKNYARRLDVEVPIAGRWIILCGQWIYSLCVKNYNDLCYEHLVGKNFRGPAGYSKARWCFWKEQFSVISHHFEVKDETKFVAKQALEAICGFEQNVFAM